MSLFLAIWTLHEFAVLIVCLESNDFRPKNTQYLIGSRQEFPTSNSTSSRRFKIIFSHTKKKENKTSFGRFKFIIPFVFAMHCYFLIVGAFIIHSYFIESGAMKMRWKVKKMKCWPRHENDIGYTMVVKENPADGKSKNFLHA